MTSAIAHRDTASTPALPSDLEQCRALTGRRLADRFEVGQVLGYGGSSIIFEGWHLVLRHPVAVKVLRAEYAVDPDLVNHFAQEAMVTAQMRSPHVVRVFDTGLIDEAVPYTVLELLRGQTLNELRRNGRVFSPEESVDLVLQACRALDESHRQGIIHRDIKPDNLFLAELPDGTHVLKVIDFGVAKHDAAHTFLTEAWVGTPGYMAPEQISNPSQVNERADIWALGIVLFELLTGRSPFRGTSSEELMASTLRDEPLPLRVAHQGLPLEVYEAVERCLAKEPRERFCSVEELASLLTRARTRFARGEDLSTGIVRLPSNWDVRITPSHGWALPGPTLISDQANTSGKRRRVSLVSSLVAGAVFGVGVGSYLFDSERGAPTATSAEVVIERDAIERHEMPTPVAAGQELNGDHDETLVTQAALPAVPPLDVRPEVKSHSPTPEPLELMPLPPPQAGVTGLTHPKPTPSARAVAVEVAASVRAPVAPSRLQAVRSSAGSGRDGEPKTELEQLLTPWTGRNK